MKYNLNPEVVKELTDQFIEENKSYSDDISYYIFPQIWGSTALGYGGIGGQAITSSHTIVLYDECLNIVWVSFGGRVAYKIKDPAQCFWEDLYKHELVDTFRHSKYVRNE